MKRVFFALLSVGFLWSCNQTNQSKQADSSKDSLSFFKTEKKEMKQVFTALQLGEVKPDGWLKSQIERDLANGLSAVTDILTPEEMNDDLFVTKQRGAVPDSVKGSWLKDLMWWRGEQQGYWMDGLLRNAWLINDKANIEKVKKRLDYIIDNQGADGYIGIYKPDMRFSNEDGNGELWTQARIVWVMLTYYDMTRDNKYLQAIKKSVDCTMKNFAPDKKNPFNTELYGGGSHGLMYAENVAWLYKFTNEQKYRDYTVWLYQAYCESKPYDNDIHYTFLKDPNFNFIGHSAHTFEHLRVLLDAWNFQGSPKFDTLFNNYRTKLEKVLLPSGGGFGYENMWGLTASPDSTPIEYCAITELQLSAQKAMMNTGQSYWGDVAQKLFYNVAQGARLPDCKGVTYCKTDNCNHLNSELLGYSKKENGIGYGKKDDRYKYSPTQLDVAQCCAPQSTRCYPYFVANMWMKSEKGIAAVLFGPSIVNTTINNVKVEIKEVTNFPFDDQVTFEISPEKETAFELTIRIPEWGANYELNAANAEIKKEGSFCYLTKTWKKGDKVTVTFKPTIIAKKANNGEYYLQRGEIVYCLDIPNTVKNIKDWKLKGLFDQYYFAKEGFDYKLQFDGTPETAFGFQFSTQATGTNMWVNSPSFLKGSMTNPKTGKKNEVKLVPIGSTILRQVTFPVGN